MKKLFTIFFFVFAVNIIGQTWTFLSDRGTPLAAYYLGDYMTSDISFAINQDTWEKIIDFGIGKNSDGSDWTWIAAEWSYQSGNDRYWKYTADNVVQFNSTGNWYYAGRFTMPTVYYADQNWTENRTTLGASSFFTVNSLSNPSDITKSAGDGQVTINWSKWNSKGVIIIRITSGSFTDPTNGTSYSLGNTIGDGTVVYKGDDVTFINNGLNNGTTYTYKLYSNNNNYYSSGVEVQETPLPVELTSFKASVIGKDVKLNWQTTTEINNFGFEVERASLQVGTSPIQSWTKIGFVNGHGNSSSLKSYSFTDRDVLDGSYSYRLKQIDADGNFVYSPKVEVTINNIPIQYKLSQNYPNPFNPSTIIKYSLPSKEFVQLKVFNVLGNEIATLVNQVQEAGNYTIEFNAAKINTTTSGIYFYRLETGSFVDSRKMMLVK
jgi:hypothetical protein